MRKLETLVEKYHVANCYDKTMGSVHSNAIKITTRSKRQRKEERRRCPPASLFEVLRNKSIAKQTVKKYRKI